MTFDSLGAGLPAVIAGKLFNKKVVIRLGGDFLWEKFVESGRGKVTMAEFYQKKLHQRFIILFRLIIFALQNTDKIVFTTEFQKGLFVSYYGLRPNKVFMIRNVFEKKNESPKEPVISAKSQENNVQPKASTTTVTQKPTEKPRGEPVFIKTTIDSKDKINLLTFKSKFIGAYESRGALTISIDGESIGIIYENTFLRQEYFHGVPLQKEVYYMVYFKEKLPGKHMVEFRLDPLNRNVKSNIEIADVRAIYDQNPREADNAKGNSFYNNAESATRGYLVSFLNFSNDKIERISTNDAISSPSYCTLKKIQFLQLFQ